MTEAPIWAGCLFSVGDVDPRSVSCLCQALQAGSVVHGVDIKHESCATLSSLSQLEFIWQTLLQSICLLGWHWCAIARHIRCGLKGKGPRGVTLPCCDWILNDGVERVVSIFPRESRNTSCGIDGELCERHLQDPPGWITRWVTFSCPRTLISLKRISCFPC